MIHARFRTLLCLSAALLAAPAWAQAEEPDAEDIVVTAQRANQTGVVRGGSVGVLGDKAAADVPFSIKSYNAALILNQQSLTLGQVLENDPTIRTTYGFGNAAEQFVIRGFTLSGDDVGLDGLYGITPRQLVAPELYESVQVLNGASAFLNGAAPGGSGIGGSVNLIPKRAGANDLTRVTASYLSKAHFGGSIDVARRFGAVGVRINGAARRGDVAIDDEFRSAYVIGAALDYQGAAVRLSLDLAYQRVEVRRLRPKVTVTSFVPRVPGADSNYAQDFTFTTLRDVFGIAAAEWDFADNAMLYLRLGARDGSEEGIYSGLTVNDPATGAATGSALFVPRTDNNESGQAGVRVKLRGGGVSHEINVGANHVRQVNRNAFDFLGGFAGFATNLYDTPQVPQPPTGFVGGDLDDPFPVGRVRLTSFFASDTLGLLNDRLLLTGGLRLQRIDQRAYNYYNGGALDTRYDEDAITPVIGLVVKPTERLSLFANRIEGLQQGPTAPLDPVLVNPGEVFAPFRSTQYEIGGKLAVGTFNASLALFRTTLPTGIAVPEPGLSGFFRFGVFGEQRNQGIEFALDGELADGLRVIAGASVLDAELQDTAGGVNDGKDAPGVADLLANANVEWDLPFVPGLTLTGRVVHTGSQAVNAANTLRIGDWTRFDLGARYVIALGDAPLTLRVGIDNVTNERYWASTFETFGTSLLQGQPRTFRFSASLDL